MSSAHGHVLGTWPCSRRVLLLCHSRSSLTPSQCFQRFMHFAIHLPTHRFVFRPALSLSGSSVWVLFLLSCSAVLFAVQQRTAPRLAFQVPWSWLCARDDVKMCLLSRVRFDPTKLCACFQI